MPQFLVGTSGWAYASWKPNFYPEKLAQKKFLNHYASLLNTVEVNFTFRQLVKETTIQNWIEQTPADFRFAIKAHQVITHIRRLKETQEFLPRFLASIAPLANAGKLGPVLFQLPPNLKLDAPLLDDFLSSVPRGLPSAFEFRNESWFTDTTWEVLKKHSTALCVAETEERTTPDVVTGPFIYYRFRKPSSSLDERNGMVLRIQEHMAAGRDVFAYFKHEETPAGALYAVNLKRDIEAGRATPTVSA